MTFINELRESKDLFRHLVCRKRLGKVSVLALQEIMTRYGIKAGGTVATQKTLGLLLGVTRRTIIRWKDEGMPAEIDGSYDPLKVIAWRWENVGDELMDNDTKGEAKKWDVNIRENGELLTGIELEKAPGVLLYMEILGKQMDETARQIKNFMLDRSRRIAPHLVGKDINQIRAILEADSLEILTLWESGYSSKTEEGHE